MVLGGPGVVLSVSGWSWVVIDVSRLSLGFLVVPGVLLNFSKELLGALGLKCHKLAHKE